MARGAAPSTAGRSGACEASGKYFEMPDQVARRWLTRGAAATVHRVDQEQAEQKQGNGAS
ncbi:hypothetical protein MSTO_53530 [Mycobacterium stomatepiae]|uniref:Uncharacterized protein n=1 Tax=Mycobacterium stomatepiae TaxID=470076 RepID=A0A7I7QFZ0_9MYCO|nr:hypothetical protein MSTO_53530 [Mycobacterium stomatepiae]